MEESEFRCETLGGQERVNFVGGEGVGETEEGVEGIGGWVHAATWEREAAEVHGRERPKVEGGAGAFVAHGFGGGGGVEGGLGGGLKCGGIAFERGGGVV